MLLLLLLFLVVVVLSFVCFSGLPVRFFIRLIQKEISISINIIMKLIHAIKTPRIYHFPPFMPYRPSCVCVCKEKRSRRSKLSADLNVPSKCQNQNKIKCHRKSNGVAECNVALRHRRHRLLEWSVWNVWNQRGEWPAKELPAPSSPHVTSNQVPSVKDARAACAPRSFLPPACPSACPSLLCIWLDRQRAGDIFWRRFLLLFFLSESRDIIAFRG